MIRERRVLALLAAAIVVVVVAFVLASRERRGAAPTAGQPVLEGFKAAVNDVTEIRIVKGDGTRTTLRKEPDGWRVAEREYSADSGKLRKLLLDLGALRVVEEKTADPESYARLGVEDVESAQATGARIDAVTPEKTYSLIVGRTSGMNSTFVRVSDAKQSHLAAPRIVAEAEPKQWLDRRILDIPQARIREVTIEPAEGPSYTVTRENKEQADFTVAKLPKGRELSYPAAANAVAGELAAFDFDDVRKAPAGDAATKPAASATFRSFDGLEVEVDGWKEDDRHYVAIAARSTGKESADDAKSLAARVNGWQFEIPGYKYDRLFKPLEELLKPKD